MRKKIKRVYKNPLHSNPVNDFKLSNIECIMFIKQFAISLNNFPIKVPSNATFNKSNTVANIIKTPQENNPINIVMFLKIVQMILTNLLFI